LLCLTYHCSTSLVLILLAVLSNITTCFNPDSHNQVTCMYVSHITKCSLQVVKINVWILNCFVHLYLKVNSNFYFSYHVVMSIIILISLILKISQLKRGKNIKCVALWFRVSVNINVSWYLKYDFMCLQVFMFHDH